MRLCVDTFNVGVLEEAAKTGIVGGVTHNPVGVSKEGHIDYVENLLKLCAIFDKYNIQGPINTELATQIPGEEDVGRMVEDGLALASLDKRIHVKVALSGPAGIATIKKLGEQGVKTNATIVYNVVQALVAAEAGATIVSLFGGPLTDANCNPIGPHSERMDIVGPVREIYDRYGYKTKILNVARRAIDVAESAIKGADMVTMQYDLFMALAKDPWTDGRLADFMAKWAAVHGTDNWITAVKNRARR
ncbi:MAG: transaldolase family protein [Bacillota bacterium]